MIHVIATTDRTTVCMLLRPAHHHRWFEWRHRCGRCRHSKAFRELKDDQKAERLIDHLPFQGCWQQMREEIAAQPELCRSDDTGARSRFR
jgi:hypothetical protein